MKASDVIAQLFAVLPTKTDLFSESIGISSLTFSGGVVTANTLSAHGRTTGDFVNITGAENPIALSSLTRIGTIGSGTTVSDHDLTLSAGDIRRGKTVNLSGSVESEFNGTFVLLSVDNRRNFTFTMADTGATTATGSPVADDASQQPGFNGWYQVTVINTTTLTYAVSQSLAASAGASPIMNTTPRISGALTFDRASDAYTKQSTNKLWGFVVLGDTVASKSRDIRSDMTSTMTSPDAWNQRITEQFALFVFIPTAKNDTSGRIARDQVEDIRLPIFQSILGAKFPTGLFATDQYVATFVSDGFTDYNTSYYVHEFNFEMAADVTFDDTVGYDVDVAFRDIDLTVINAEGNRIKESTANIDLDDSPL